MPEERIHVGSVLYGFCGGSFGRDSYDDKLVVAMSFDWVVVRNPNGTYEFCSTPGLDINRELAEYLTPEPEVDWTCPYG